MLTSSDILNVLRILLRVLLALVNQGEWLGAWAGSINLLTGVVRIPAFGIDVSDSALGTAYGVQRLEWQGLSGSISLWGEVRFAVEVNGLTAEASPLSARAQRLHLPQQPPQQEPQLPRWNLGRYLNASVVFRNAEIRVDTSGIGYKRDGVGFILRSDNVAVAVDKLTRLTLTVENADVQFEPRQELGDEEYSIIDGDDEDSTISLNSLTLLAERGEKTTAALEIGEIKVTLPPARHDAILLSVIGVCEVLSPALSVIKEAFDVRQKKLFRDLEAIESSSTPRSRPVDEVDDLLFFHDAQTLHSVSAAPKPLELTLRLQSIILAHGLAKSRPAVVSVRNILFRHSGESLRIEVGDLAQSSIEGTMHSCIVGRDGEFIASETHSKWIELKKTGSSLEEVMTGEIQPTRICVELCDWLPLAFFCKEVGKTIAATTAMHRLIATSLSMSSTLVPATIPTKRVRVNVSCGALRVDILSRRLARLENQPLMSLFAKDLVAFSQDGRLLELGVDSFGICDSLVVGGNVKASLHMVTNNLSSKAFQLPIPLQPYHDQQLGTQAVNNWVTAATVSCLSTDVSIESVTVHIVDSHLESLGYVQGLLQEFGAICAPAEISLAPALVLREVCLPTLLAPCVFSLAVQHVGFSLDTTHSNLTSKLDERVRVNLFVHGNATTADDDASATAAPTLQLRVDNIGNGFASRVQLHLNKAIDLESTSSWSTAETEGAEQSFSVTLLKLSPLASGAPVVKMLSFPRELFLAGTSGKVLALGFKTMHCSVSMADLSADFDAHTLAPFKVLLQRCASAARLARGDARSVFISLPSNGYYVAAASSIPTNGSNEASSPPQWQMMQPSSVLSIELQAAQLCMSHERKRVFRLSTADADLSVVRFSSQFMQVCGVISSLRLVESTLATSIHRNIFHNLDDNDPNVVDFHFTKMAGQCGLLEMRADHLQALYLQRCTMTLVTFLRDHYFPRMAATSLKPPSSSQVAGGPQSLSRSLGEMLESEAQAQAQAQPRAQTAAPDRPLGMLRLSISIVQSELHLPTNSCGNDALVAVLANAIIYKPDPAIQEQDPTYCLGPYLSKRVWLSELENVQRTMRALKPRRDDGTQVSQLLQQYQMTLNSSSSLSSNDSPITWKLPTQGATHLSVPAAVTLRGGPEFWLELEVTDSMICNWVNHNIVGENLNVDVTVHLKPVTTEESAAAGLPPAIRNTVKVDVRADCIEGTLSQGQYMTIVNMIQQNFMEQQAVVPDLFVLPTPRKVELGENVYGKQSLETHLPIISTVPVHIRSGKLTAIENMPDYYELVGRISSTQSRNEEAGVHVDLDRNSVPKWSYHNLHRSRLFSRLPSSARIRVKPGGLHGNKGSNSRLYRMDTESSDGTKSPDHEKRFVEPMVLPNFGEPILCIHFVGLELDFYRFHGGGGNGIFCSAHTLVVTAEKDSTDDGGEEEDDQVGGEEQNADADFEFGSQEYFAHLAYEAAERLLFAPKKVMEAKSKEPKPTDADGASFSDSESAPHIVYRQQGNGNLRRCVVEISESVAVIHVLPFTAAMRFFVEPVQLTSMRNLGMIEKRGLGPLDFKAALDVEVLAKSTVFCLPNVVQAKTKSAKDVSSGLCLHGDFTYQQAWRGFLNVGPGKITQIFKLEIYSIFIAPLHEIRISGAESLIDACLAEFRTEFMVVPDETHGEENRALISPWINLDSAWSAKKFANDGGKPSGIRLMSLVISKIRRDADKDGEDDDDGNEDAGPEWVTLEDKVERVESSIERSSTQLKVSLKDILLVQSALQQLNEGITLIPVRQPLNERFFLLYNGRRDLDHLPLLTHYLVPTKMTEKWVMRNNDVIADICNYRLILRNNTYNIRIAKINMTNICFSYNHSLEHLHMAAGLSLSAWTHNEMVDKWEPVVETVTMTAIGATDASVKDSSLNSQRTRIDVYCEPLEINASELAISGLIRKLNLADVVTTSSAHLPPYRICNDLGVEVKIDIGIDGFKAISEAIASNCELPIEARKLSQAAARYHRIGPGGTDRGTVEHLLNITFSVRGDLYKSSVPVPIDREGLFPFDMKIAGGAGATRKSTGPDVPYAMVNMTIKEDGGREIVLRSMLNLRNHTSRTIHVSVRLNGLTAETMLGPEDEWNVPVSLAFPQAAIFLRLDERSEWFEALHTLKTLVLNGSWGSPYKLAAELCGCKQEGDDAWMLLLKPEMIDSSGSTKCLLPVKYPVKERVFAALNAKHGTAHLEGGVDGMAASAMLDELKAYTKQQFSNSSSGRQGVQSLCVQLVAPLQIANLVCQPVAYRLADTDGLITAEGVIPTGEVVDVHSLSQLFHNKIYLSLRLPNYCWSKWTKIFTRSSPYPSAEKIFEATLNSLDLSHQGTYLNMPALDIVISLREHMVRLSCPVIINNRSGVDLDLCEASSPESFIPQSSRPGADMLMSTNPALQERGRSLTRGKRALSRASKKYAGKSSRDRMAEEEDSDDSIGRGFEVEPVSDGEGDFEPRSAMSGRDDYFQPTDKAAPGSGSKAPTGPRRAARSSLLPLPIQQKKVVNLIVHFPMDHFRKIEVAAPSSWTLADVFARISSKVALSLENAKQDSYCFFAWEDGRLGPRRAECSPVAEADLFGRMAGSFMTTGGASSSDSLADEDSSTHRKLSPEALQAQERETGHGTEDHHPALKNRSPSISSEQSSVAELSQTSTSTRFASASSMLSRSLSSMAKRISSTTILSSSPSHGETREEKDKDKVPPSMTFNMIADCSMPLPMDMSVEDLVHLGVSRIRLAHVFERDIYKQASTIITEVVKKEGVMGSVFGRKKNIHKANYIKVEGDFPFNPHRLLGLTPSLSLRVPLETEWSDALDLREGALSIMQGSQLSVSSNNASPDSSAGIDASVSSSVLNERHYEFGAFVERGKGFFQNVTSVSIVTKHLLISELSIPLEIRQIGVEDPYTRTTLLPGSVQSFHYPTKHSPKLLQVRRTYLSDFSDDDSDEETNEDGVSRGNVYPRNLDAKNQLVSDWCGEIDISNLGIVYAKLRNPLLILKVQVEEVGASLVATFCEQSTAWPPYRLDNLTSLNCRFKQYSLVPGSIVNSATIQSVTGVTGTSSQQSRKDRQRRSTSENGGAASTAGTLKTESEDVFKKMLESYTPVPTAATLATQFDFLSSRSSSSYSWDYPKTGDKTLRVEFAQGPQLFEAVDVNLDDVGAKPKTITLRRSLPSLGNPLAEGYLMRQDIKEDAWVPTYCILKADVFFMFSDDTRSDLLGIINLSRPSTEAGGDILLAEAVKYTNQGWDLYSTINQNLFGDGGRAARLVAERQALDPNKVRLLLLRLADNLGVFSNMLRPSAGHRRASAPKSDSRQHAPSLYDEDPSGLLTDELEDEISDYGDDSPPPSPRVSEPREHLSNDLSPPHRRNSSRKGSIPSIQKQSLKELIKRGVPVEALLDHLQSQPLRLCDIYWSMLDLGLADDEEDAKNLFDTLCLQGIFVSHSRAPRGLTSTLDGGMGSDEDDGATGPGDVQTVPLSLRASEDDHTSTRLRNKQKTRSRRMASEWVIRPPVLQKELMEMASASKPQEESDTYGFLRPGGAGQQQQQQEIGFTIMLGESKHNFKCSSEMEFLGWIQACRQSIELSWVEFMRGYRLEGQNQMTMESFKVQVSLKVRADGPTRVLEITENDSGAGAGKDSGVGEDGDAASTPAVPGAESDSKLQQAPDGKDLATVKEESGKEDEDDEEEEKADGSREPKETADAIKPLSAKALEDAEDSKQTLVSVSIVLQSVALSVIDSEPGEVVYIALQDIEISIERSRQRVKMGSTVQQIQVSNQLLNPMFPVTLFPRPHKGPSQVGSNGGGGEGSSSGSAPGTGHRLMLPGLHQRGDTYPALHFFFQQKYHQNDKEERAKKKAAAGLVPGGGARGAKGATQNLLYFDMATLWVAPMVLDVDEETMVRAVRLVQNVRAAVQRPDISSLSAVRADILAQQHLGTRSWGTFKASDMSRAYSAFLSSGKSPYSSYNPALKDSQGIFFSLLQLHPLDIRMSFRASLDFTCTTSELAYVSLVSQLDSARLCLNALIAEHAYGSVPIILDILAKHYQASLWRQFHKLIGSTDFVEGSVGLVANLGTGVYDLFYEPIDGLLDENSSFLTGLSKGGKSLASRTIGGTSAQISKVASGLGKGVSMLTLDSEFQRSRTSRRMKKTNTLSEGFYVGTRELGKSIMDGITGVVASPYQGWKEDGTAGAVQGLGKGIIGLALKPAVGVFDLASRATEGIRNTAFGSESGDREGIFRTRIPRAFGRASLLLPYELTEAAAQFLSDKTSGFNRQCRMRVVYHQRLHRRVTDPSSRSQAQGLSHSQAQALSQGLGPAPGQADDSAHVEAWGMAGGGSYVALVSPDRIALAWVRSERGCANPDLRLVWSCPAHCVDQLFSDPRGDLVLSVNRAAAPEGEITALRPVITDLLTQNYFITQALLEQTVGLHMARLQCAQPKTGFVEKDLLKRYSSGIKSILLSPTKHTFQLSGCVLYEFTLFAKDKDKEKEKEKARAVGLEATSRATLSLADTERDINAALSGADPENPLSDRAPMPLADSPDASNDAPGTASKESTPAAVPQPPADNITRLVADLFAQEPRRGGAGADPVLVPPAESLQPYLTPYSARTQPRGALSYIYPLVDVTVTGPVEDKSAGSGPPHYSISFARVDGQSMRVLKREAETEQLTEHHKSMLTLIFPRRETALAWRAAIEAAAVRDPQDTVKPYPVSSADAKKKLSMRQMVERAGKAQAELPPEEPVERSIFGALVIPTSGSDQHRNESLKVEIAKTLSGARR